MVGQVVVRLSMSLDGFIAGPNDGPEQPLGEGGSRLFEWYSNGDTDFVTPSGTMTFRTSSESAAMLRETVGTAGAVVTGRRTFDIANGWGGRHPWDVPIFVVTHAVPSGWDDGGSPFTFVTDGVESAVKQARAVAGEKDVAVGAASLVQQCLRAGLLDAIHLDLVPVLLGGGVRLFDQLGDLPVALETTRVIHAPGVTHMDFRVVKG
jgi:dihydrofolate reductase